MRLQPFFWTSFFQSCQRQRLLIIRSARGLVLHAVIVVAGREALVGHVVHTLAAAPPAVTIIAVASVDLDRP
jgi:hypothetical protein